ncbi:MAG TPA: glycosyltransferase [Candidatus Dormibacteraeota bacterium]|nr:glycosyltransferase [Candidatus Dormibacteraeota bacterium]
MKFRPLLRDEAVGGIQTMTPDVVDVGANFRRRSSNTTAAAALAEPREGRVMNEYSVVDYCRVHSWFDRQHFYQGLARSWARTRPHLFVSSAVPWPGGRPGHHGGRWIGGGYLHQPFRGLWILEPVITRGARFRSIRHLHDVLVAQATVRAIRAIGFDLDRLLVWAYWSHALPLLDRLPGACSVYWTGDEVINPNEPELLRRVDHVFAVSPDAMTRHQTMVGAKLTAMPMAINPDPFIAAQVAVDPPADLRELRRPLIGYGGAISARIDWEIIREVANRTTGTLVLVGPAVDEEGARQLKDLSRLPSVAWLGHRGLDEAPAYLAAFDAALIPYKRNRFNDGSNPVKFYEYLAAGVPVISVALPALLAFGDVATFTDDPASFAEAANRAAAKPVDVAAVRHRQQIAREHSYEQLVNRIEARIADSGCLSS